MKTLVVWKPILLFVLALMLAQIACNMGAQPVSSSPINQPTQAVNNTVAPADTQLPEATATKSERGTPDEAKAMLQLAVDHYNQAGRDQALKDFNNGAPPFIDRDLYVVCLGGGGVITANGGFPQYVGISADALKDAEGKPVGTTIWTEGNAQNEGSIEFNWINPVSGNTEPKVFFFQKVGEDVCGVGAYNP